MQSSPFKPKNSITQRNPLPVSTTFSAGKCYHYHLKPNYTKSGIYNYYLFGMSRFKSIDVIHRVIITRQT